MTATTLLDRTRVGVRSRRTRSAVRFVERWWLFVTAGLAWEFVALRSELYFFPPLSRILAKLWETWVVRAFDRGWAGSPYAIELLPSLSRALTGLLIAIVVGVTLGILIGLSTRAASMFEPSVHYLRGIPPVAILPILIIVLGIGPRMRIAAIAFACTWPILLNSIQGVRGVDPVKLETAQAFGVVGLARVRSVVLPAASPSIFAGLRVSTAVALILMIVSEMIAGGSGGLGERVVFAQRNFRIVDMWAGILIIGALGYVVNTIFERIEHRSLIWHRRDQEGTDE